MPGQGTQRRPGRPAQPSPRPARGSAPPPAGTLLPARPALELCGLSRRPARLGAHRTDVLTLGVGGLRAFQASEPVPFLNPL